MSKYSILRIAEIVGIVSVSSCGSSVFGVCLEAPGRASVGSAKRQRLRVQSMHEMDCAPEMLLVPWDGSSTSSWVSSAHTFPHGQLSSICTDVLRSVLKHETTLPYGCS